MTMMLFMPAVGWAKTVRLYDLHLYDRLLQRYQGLIGLLGHVHGRASLRSLLKRCPQTLKTLLQIIIAATAQAPETSSMPWRSRSTAEPLNICIARMAMHGSNHDFDAALLRAATEGHRNGWTPSLLMP